MDFGDIASKEFIRDMSISLQNLVKEMDNLKNTLIQIKKRQNLIREDLRHLDKLKPLKK